MTALDKAQHYEFLVEVMRILEQHDMTGELFWRVYDEDVLHPYFTVNDAFWWATSDAEEIVPEHMDILQQASADLLALDTESFDAPLSLIAELYAARVRGMRPQRPWLELRTPVIRELFETCGPERTSLEEG